MRKPALSEPERAAKMAYVCIAGTRAVMNGQDAP
jgi:hypothetical protein